jgi:23S rRNA (pseudouridine1915-N3)-methyltransferase
MPRARPRTKARACWRRCRSRRPWSRWTVRGRTWSSEQLAQRLEHWRGQGRDLAFLIGGPEGHSPEVITRADEQWSLGPLTLPHMLVRLVLAEQLYRAAALLANHPYHRA